MMNIAISVPEQVSGLSGRVWSLNAETGQIKVNDSSRLYKSVRSVRSAGYSPIHTCARINRASINIFKNLLGIIEKTGQTGQTLKAIEIINVLLSGQADVIKDTVGQVGQKRVAGPSGVLTHKGYSHLAVYAVPTFFCFRNFGMMNFFSQLAFSSDQRLKMSGQSPVGMKG